MHRNALQTIFERNKGFIDKTLQKKKPFVSEILEAVQHYLGMHLIKKYAGRIFIFTYKNPWLHD